MSCPLKFSPPCIGAFHAWAGEPYVRQPHWPHPIALALPYLLIHNLVYSRRPIPLPVGKMCVLAPAYSLREHCLRSFTSAPRSVINQCLRNSQTAKTRLNKVNQGDQSSPTLYFHCTSRALKRGTHLCSPFYGMQLLCVAAST